MVVGLLAAAPLTSTSITLTSVTAFAAVLLGFLTAILGFLNQRKIKAAAVNQAVTAGKVDTISVNVDGRLSQLFERLDAVTAARESGVPVPPAAPAAPEKTLIPPPDM